MSVTTVVDVWCDHPGCVEWTDGVTRRDAPVRPAEARVVARRHGWTRPTRAGRRVDLCPAHSTPTAADRAWLARDSATREAVPTVSVFDLARGLGAAADERTRPDAD